MLYVCEFEFERDGDWYLCWPFWPGRIDGTQGEDFDDAVEMAADWLRIMVEDYLMRGEEIPKFPKGNKPQRGGNIVTIAVDESLEKIPSMTAAEAARVLGISTARVAQLCKAHMLDSWKVGGTRLVSRESVEYRLEHTPQAGRPHKERHEFVAA